MDTDNTPSPEVATTDTPSSNRPEVWKGPGHPLPLSFGNRARRRKLMSQINLGIKKGTIQ